MANARVGSSDCVCTATNNSYWNGTQTATNRRTCAHKAVGDKRHSSGKANTGRTSAQDSRQSSAALELRAAAYMVGGHSHSQCTSSPSGDKIVFERVEEAAIDNCAEDEDMSELIQVEDDSN